MVRVHDQPSARPPRAPLRPFARYATSKPVSLDGCSMWQCPAATQSRTKDGMNVLQLNVALDQKYPVKS